MGLWQTLFYGWGWRVRDATGRKVRLYDHFNVPAGGQVPPVPVHIFESVRANCDRYELAERQKSLRWVLAFLGVFPAVMLITDPGFAYAPVRNTVFLVSWCSVIALLVWGYGKLIRNSPATYADELLAHGHCPCCGYGLQKTHAQTVTCPECGAVWHTSKLAEMPNTHPPAPSE